MAFFLQLTQAAYDGVGTLWSQWLNCLSAEMIILFIGSPMPFGPVVCFGLHCYPVTMDFPALLLSCIKECILAFY